MWRGRAAVEPPNQRPYSRQYEETTMALPIRPGSSGRQIVPPAMYPAALELDSERQSGGLPWLWGELGQAAPACLRLILRVHNRAGIPIVEAHSQIEAGQQQISFTDLHA